MVAVRGIQHVGFTVPDMEEAVRFFESMFSAVTVMNLGEVDLDDEFLGRRLGIPPGRRMKDQRVITCGKGGNIELFEYAGEPAPPRIKRNSEVGAFHIAFEVDDAWAAAERLWVVSPGVV